MEFIEIDGSLGEGGGQILRTSVSLSCILGKGIRIRNIRSGRKEPGLRPQHLVAVTSAAEISNARLEGAQVGSTELEFVPRELSKHFSKTINVGTAGSISLVAQTLIPVAMLCGIDLDVEIIGGTEVPWSPTIDYLERVALPLYRRIGASISIQTKRRGYYPKGGGVVSLKVSGSKSTARGLSFSDHEAESEVTVLSVSRNLPSHVTQRQAASAEDVLRRSGITKIKRELDSTGTALSPGSSVLVCSNSETKYIGSDSLGERGKSSEDVGLEGANGYIEQAQKRPDVDANLADMIVPVLSCIGEKSKFSTSRVTQHLTTNLAISKILSGREFLISENKERGTWDVFLPGLAEKSN